MGSRGEYAPHAEISWRNRQLETYGHTTCIVRDSFQPSRYPPFPRPRLLPQRKTRQGLLGRHGSFAKSAVARGGDRPAMHKFGFPLEDRPFTAHLTLARLQPPGLPPKLAAAVQESPSREFGSLMAREFHLIESKLKPAGAEYTTLQSFPFVAEV